MTITWVHGELSASGEGRVSVLDHGFTVGDGVFETCEVIEGEAFALTRHLARLELGAARLGIEAPNPDVVRGATREVLTAYGPRGGRLRITVTSGVGPLGPMRGGGLPTIVVSVGPAPSPAQEVRAVRVPWVRNERSAVTGIKTTSYAENVVALTEAKRRGADEALLANSVGELCEGTASNVFVELGGELLTPPLSSGCLAGITRELVLEWAEGLPVREAEPGELMFSMLDDAANSGLGLAITGTLRGIVPVVELDGTGLPTGPLTRAVRDLFRNRMREDLDP